MEQDKIRRRRGVMLTTTGLKRLLSAIQAVERAENNGDRFTFEELSDRIHISTKTLSRLWSPDASIDVRTLKLCFSAFNLELSREDYKRPREPDSAILADSLTHSSDNKRIDQFQAVAKDTLAQEQLIKAELFFSYPDGPVPLNSPFYIERPPLEKLVYQEITQPGCVIRIRAPKQMGKSSLVLRLLAEAQQQEYYTVNLDCQQFDALYLSNLNQFLRSFCWQVATELGIEPNLDSKWNQEIGSKLSCSFYFKTYLLKQIERPVVFILEQVEHFFEYPQIAQEFFSLLRSWYEEARRDANWQKLRLVVVYSTEVYVSLDINRSPFNIGLPLCLPEFTQQQVEELAQRHGLNWNSGNEANQLMSLVGGHPALIQIGLYHLCRQGITLEKLLQEAFANGGIYRYHLLQHLMTLQENASLAEAYAKVVTASSSISLHLFEAHQLESLGLICYDGALVRPRCQLYYAYFKKQLSTIVKNDNS